MIETWKTGDRDKAGNVCVFIKGPIHIWETPAGSYTVYLLVKNGDYMDTLFNYTGSREQAQEMADRTYDKLNKYGRSIITGE